MQAMKLFMGALAMASALEVDTESGPNKIQVAAQPGNAGVVSKTIKLATAAGVSAMAVEAINKLGTFETSPSGNQEDPCVEKDPNTGKCVLCIPGKFLTVAGDCEKKCPMNENPFWCPYQYCLDAGKMTDDQFDDCGKAKTTMQKTVGVFPGQCRKRAASGAAGNAKTCTYCKWSTSGAGFYTGLDCDLEKTDPYAFDRVDAEIKGFTFYFDDPMPMPPVVKARCPDENCIGDLSLQNQGWTKFPESTADALKCLIDDTPGTSTLFKFNYGNKVGPVDSGVKDKLTPVLKKLVSGATDQGIFLKDASDMVTDFTNLVLPGNQGINAKFVEFEDTSKLAQLPLWVCDVKILTGGKLNFKNTDACGTASNAANFAAVAAATGNGCTQGSSTCCEWTEGTQFDGGCGQKAGTLSFLFV